MRSLVAIRNVPRVQASVQTAAPIPIGDRRCALRCSSSSTRALQKLDSPSARAKERTIRSVLHQVTQYEENTKLSLKVYHLQELALQKVRLTSDTRYQQLKDQIAENVQNLSPAQSVSAAVSFHRLKLRQPSVWTKLAKSIEKHAGVKKENKRSALSHSQLSLCMFACAKARARVKDSFFYRLLKHMKKTSGQWNEFDLAWILYCMRIRKLKAVNRDSRHHRLWSKILRLIALNFENKLHFFSPKGCVIILSEFARMEIYPKKVFRKAVRRIRSKIDRLSDRSLASFALTFALFQERDKKAFRAITQAALRSENAVRMSDESFSMTLYALAKCKYRDEHFLAFACQRLQNSVAHPMPDASLGVCAYSLGKLGVRHTGAWDVLEKRLVERLEFLSPLNLANIVQAMGKVGVGPLDPLVAKACVDNVSGFSPKQLINVLDAYALLGQFPDFFPTFLEHYIRMGEGGWCRQRSTQLSRILFALTLEAPDLVRPLPPSTHVLIERFAGDNFQEKPNREYHKDLSLVMDTFAKEYTLLWKKGPYFVDVFCEGVTLDLLGEGSFCPMTHSLLGFPRMKQRQLELMGLPWVYVRRKPWVKSQERREEVRDALRQRIPDIV